MRASHDVKRQAIQIAAGGRNSIRQSLVHTGEAHTDTAPQLQQQRVSASILKDETNPDIHLGVQSVANVARSIIQTSLVLNMSTEMFAKTPMEVAVYQLHNFSISFFSSLLGGDVVSVKLDNSASGASVVAIDNKIEQAMDLVKNHLMYAVREEVEILKEQIKELAEKNNQLERENYLLKNLASPEQLEKFQSRIPSDVLLPLDNQSAQVTQDQQQQTCIHSTGSAV